MKRFVIVMAITVFAALACPQQAPAPQTASALPFGGEFTYLVLQAVQDVDDLSPSSQELEWQLTRIQARKSATELIRGVKNEAEFGIAGDVWDYLQNKITQRIQIQAGMSADGSRADANRHRALALSRAGIDPARLYPHSSPPL